MIKKKIVWQADAFALIAPAGGNNSLRAPVGFVFDPHAPFILASRVFPVGYSESACLLAAVKEAMLTHGVTPSEVCVRFGKEKALQSLAAKSGFTLVICDELPELAAVKQDMAKCMRGAFELAGIARMH